MWNKYIYFIPSDEWKDLINNCSKRKINIAINTKIIIDNLHSEIAKPFAIHIIEKLSTGYYDSCYSAMSFMRFINDINILNKIYELYYDIIDEDTFFAEYNEYLEKDSKFWYNQEYNRASDYSRLLEYHQQ